MMVKVVIDADEKNLEATEDGVKKSSHTYDEALDLAGNGFYNISLLITTSLSFFAMCVDMFSFSIVVSLASCDLQLDLTQKSILLSTPFVGSIIMAYAWGYISDTKGRKFSMMIGLTGGFVMSSLCAFAPNWVVLAILKFIGTCFCSSAQSGTYTMIGESCCNRVKGSYMLIISSFTCIGTAVYFSLGYFISHLSFTYDLSFITFVPWRLLIIILALPLGLSSVGLMFFYESPKFLLNVGQEGQALETLRSISKRNGVKIDYPVKRLVLNEEGNVRNKDAPLMRSLWEQTAPLFKPPLLFWTLLLYYLTFASYATAGSLFMWMPFFANAITSGQNSSSNQNQGLCGIVTHMNSQPSENVSCSATIDVTMVYATIISSCCYCSLNIVISRLASRRKALSFVIFLISLLSAVVTVVVPHRVSGFFYYGVLVAFLETGVIATYFVDLFPTSFRGMASCLGVMIGRFSNLVGINIVGPFMLSNCNVTFYGLSALLASGILTAVLLPSDRPKKIL